MFAKRILDKVETSAAAAPLAAAAAPPTELAGPPMEKPLVALLPPGSSPRAAVGVILPAVAPFPSAGATAAPPPPLAPPAAAAKPDAAVACGRCERLPETALDNTSALPKPFCPLPLLPAPRTLLLSHRRLAAAKPPLPPLLVLLSKRDACAAPAAKEAEDMGEAAAAGAASLLLCWKGAIQIVLLEVDGDGGAPE